ncbi:MAG: bifunctional serine/threonine-protein kinase/formylglycine-generating enzyme family protein [Pyrinomonadaceae bacterium]
MNKERWQEISRIFHAASEKSSAERADFLYEACGEDAELRLEIETLLAASDKNDSFIDLISIGLGSVKCVPRLSPGEMLGSFQIVDMLGAGGMGEVYLAKDLRLNRQVALKILPPTAALDKNANRRFLREAQAAAALEHPHICTIHEIGEQTGFSYIVMQYVEGETLSAKIKSGKLKPLEALNIALQTADALAEAHARGIVHRDIKPANIIISTNNQAKVLDFGLAKKVVLDTLESESSLKSLLSLPGMIVGTVSYMSPEQIRGAEVDARADLWSLGVVLYEMLFGKTPFSGANTVEKLAAILYQEPEKQEKSPAELSRILAKALRKEPEKRYQTAAEMTEDLRRLKQELEFAEQLELHATSGASENEIHETLSHFLASHPTIQIQAQTKNIKRKNSWKWIVSAGLMCIFLALGGWKLWQMRQISWANEQIPRVEELAKNEKNFEAYDLALEVSKYVPESTFAGVMPKISDSLSVNSEPNGAKVYLRRFQPDGRGKFPERQFIGETPINELRVARGNYILQVEKDGFAAFERTISGGIPRVNGSFIESPPVKIEAKLMETDKMPPRMVFVPAGEYSLVNWSRSTETKINLDGFFIDKYEVSNAEYKEFVASGGYWKKEFWKYPIVKDGKTIPIEEALKDFKDKTGLPAPRSWTNQAFPEGKDDFPVTDITWYEAAAYAEFRGKRLPTVFQWEKAARDGTFDPRYNAMPWGFIRQGETTDDRANFRGTGTVSVMSNEYGMSPFGAFNMAGNVSEWNLNQSPQGFITSGGAWNDLAYSFGDYGEYPGLYWGNRIGFRCAKNAPESTGDQGGQMLPPAETPDYQPSSEADFKTWLSHYEYDNKPLNAQVVEVIETNDWRREKIAFVGEGDLQAIAYLYLPKNYPRPLQVIHYVPAGDVVRGLRSLPDSVEMFLTPLIKSGRAVFAVVLKGYNERPFLNNYSPPENSTVEFRKQMVNWITDLRRGVDYLKERDDLNFQKLAFLGISNGANVGLVLTAIETRYKCLVFESAGLEKDFLNRIAETSPIKFASHIKTQKLIINGLYDETFPYNTDAKPLHKLLREPRKIVLYPGGHIPTIEFFAPTVNNWLDETLGSVNK